MSGPQPVEPEAYYEEYEGYDEGGAVGHQPDEDTQVFLRGYQQLHSQYYQGDVGLREH